jgi:hypothetical protein
MEILKTILKINPQAKVVVRGGDINTCEIEWLDGTTPVSKTEIATMIPVVEQEIANKKEQDIANKQSALNKLKALGLNDAEIKSIIG